MFRRPLLARAIEPGGRRTLGVAPVGLGVADHFALAVDGAVGGFAGDLGAPVAIEVVDHELRVMRALADVFAEIDRPHQRAVELVGLQDRIGRYPGLRIVAAAACLVQDDLVLAVAIEVADRGIVRRVALRAFAAEPIDIVGRAYRLSG